MIGDHPGRTYASHWDSVKKNRPSLCLQNQDQAQFHILRNNLYTFSLCVKGKPPSLKESMQLLISILSLEVIAHSGMMLSFFPRRIRYNQKRQNVLFRTCVPRCFYCIKHPQSTAFASPCPRLPDEAPPWPSSETWDGAAPAHAVA